MIWLTWRQHRRQALFAVLVLASLVALLVPTGWRMHDAFVDGGLAGCLDTMSRAEFVAESAAGCEEPAARFTDQYGLFGQVATCSRSCRFSWDYSSARPWLPGKRSTALTVSCGLRG